MTQITNVKQVKDKITVIGKDGVAIDYFIIKVLDGELFNISEYGFESKPEYMECTYSSLGMDKKGVLKICLHDGKCGYYELSREGFILKHLHIKQQGIIFPRINKVKAKNKRLRKEYKSTSPFGNIENALNTVYENVNIDVSDFSGTLILGKRAKDYRVEINPIDLGEEDWHHLYEKVVQITYKNKDIAEYKVLK